MLGGLLSCQIKHHIIFIHKTPQGFYKSGFIQCTGKSLLFSQFFLTEYGAYSEHTTREQGVPYPILD